MHSDDMGVNISICDRQTEFIMPITGPSSRMRSNAKWIYLIHFNLVATNPQPSIADDPMLVSIPVIMLVD